MKLLKDQKILASLSLYQTIWYCHIPCVIDCLNSREGWTGKGHLRIYPADGRLYENNGKTTIQAKGKWIKISDANFSITKPPVKIVWRNTKGSVVGVFDFNKAKFIAKLLDQGETLLIKSKDYKDTKVYLSEALDLCVESFDENYILPSMSTELVGKCIVMTNMGETWFVH